MIEGAVVSLEKEIKGKGLGLFMENLHLTMYTDRRRLLQSVLNVVSNVMNYTQKEGVTVQVRLIADFVEISVSDTGIRIREDDRENVFQPFTRLDSPVKTLVSGTGLGLYLTRKLVREVLHGKVGFMSAPRKGICNSIPIIAITSFAMMGDRENILNAGCNGYFEKPIDPLTIVDRIHDILKRMGRL